MKGEWVVGREMTFDTMESRDSLRVMKTEKMGGIDGALEAS